LEVLLGADDIPGDLAERYGYVNRALPDAELDTFVDALAMRIASFDKQAIVETKGFVNVASLPPDAEIAPEWDACIASIQRRCRQRRLNTLLERGLHKPGDVENRLGYHVGQTPHLSAVPRFDGGKASSCRSSKPPSYSQPQYTSTRLSGQSPGEHLDRDWLRPWKVLRAVSALHSRKFTQVGREAFWHRHSYLGPPGCRRGCLAAMSMCAFGSMRATSIQRAAQPSTWMARSPAIGHWTK